MLTGHRGTRGSDRIEPVVLRAAGPFEGADLDDVLTGLGQRFGQPGGEAPGSFQRPHPTPRRVVFGPVEHAHIARTVS
jgi:hypothetical protein